MSSPAPEDYWAVFGNDDWPYAVFSSADHARDWIRDTYRDGSHAYHVVHVTRPLLHRVEMRSCLTCGGVGKIRHVEDEQPSP